MYILYEACNQLTMTYEQAIIYYKNLFVCSNPVTHGAKQSIIVINVCERLQYSWLVPVIPHPSPFNGCSYLSFNTFSLVVLSCMSHAHISPPSPPLFCDPKALSRYLGPPRWVHCLQNGVKEAKSTHFQNRMVSDSVRVLRRIFGN
jgi:hypothetical protein